MQIKHAENELILRDAPGCLWLFGAFFVFVGGIFVYGALGGFTDYDKVPWWAIAFGFFVGAISVSVGIWQIASNPSSKVIIDRRTKTVFFRQRGLVGKNDRIFSFEEARDFSVNQGEDGDNDPIWRVELNLMSGETVEITTIWERSEKKCAAVAQTANEFLGK